MTTQPQDSAIVCCQHCGQMNRIKNISLDKTALCGKCGTSLDRPQQHPTPPPPTQIHIKQSSSFQPRTKLLTVVGWIIAICFSGVFIWLGSRNTTTNPSPKPPQNYYQTPPRAAPSYPAQALPLNGDIQTFTTLDPVAPLTIQTSAGSHYVVKLVDSFSKKPIMTVFVRSGMTASVEVPLGNYEFRYAAGETWYGYNHLFGPDTDYSKADKVFEFENTGSEVTGYTVTLYKVANGNLHTSQIRPTEF